MIPIVPASGKRDAFVSGTLRFDGRMPVIEGERPLREVLKEAYDSTQQDDPIILLDVDGFGDRFLNVELVKEIRIRGRDLWFVTHVENLEDVISALTGSFSGLGIPMHTMREDDLLDKASEMSDLVFPAAFVRNGTELSTGRRPDELEIIYRREGFPRLLIIDMDQLSAKDVSMAITVSESPTA